MISQLEPGKELWREATGGLQGRSPGEQQGPVLQCKEAGVRGGLCLEIPTEALVNWVIYSKMEVRTLGQNSSRCCHSVHTSVTIHMSSCHFIFYRKKDTCVMNVCIEFNFHIVILVLTLPFKLFSFTLHLYILILFFLLLAHYFSSVSRVSLFDTISPSKCQFLKLTPKDLGICLHYNSPNVIPKSKGFPIFLGSESSLSQQEIMSMQLLNKKHLSSTTPIVSFVSVNNSHPN